MLPLRHPTELADEERCGIQRDHQKSGRRRCIEYIWQSDRGKKFQCPVVAKLTAATFTTEARRLAHATLPAPIPHRRIQKFPQ